MVGRTANAFDSVDDSNWYYDQPLPPEDIAELEADRAHPQPCPSKGRYFGNDFRRRSMSIADRQALRNTRPLQTALTRSPPRKARSRSTRPATPPSRGIEATSVDVAPPPPASPPRVASESHRPMPIGSAATAEVLALTDRERRLIDFLVDEALNEWWTQNSRD